MILRRIEIFLKESGMPATRFGREAAGDPRLVSDLRRGRSAGARLCRRVEAYINRWPR
jgi:hypothetical protein